MEKRIALIFLFLTPLSSCVERSCKNHIVTAVRECTFHRGLGNRLCSVSFTQGKSGKVKAPVKAGDRYAICREKGQTKIYPIKK